MTVARPSRPQAGAGKRSGQPLPVPGDAFKAAVTEQLEQAGLLASPPRLQEVALKLTPPAEASAPEFRTAVLGLVIDLVLFTAAPGRSTALDRLARQQPPRPGSRAEQALAALKRHRLTLFELTAGDAARGYQACDLLSGEEFALCSLYAGTIAPPGTCLAARLVPHPDGSRMAVSPLVLLGAGALAEIEPWLSRDRQSLANPLRCAEVLYRNAVASQQLILPDVFAPDVFAPGDPRAADPPPRPGAAARPLPFGPEDAPVHALAAAWAALPAGQEPGEDEQLQARRLLTQPDLIDALQGLYFSREGALTAEAGAYQRLVLLQLDTLHRRAAIGNAAAVERLRGFTQEIERAIRAREISPDYRALFQELDRRARLGLGSRSEEPAGTSAAARLSLAELDKVRQRIQGLRAKTVDHGCTEEEALAAAAKVAELLDRYGLSLSELEFKQQTCEGLGVDTGRRRRGPIDDVVPTIARFCDCRTWIEQHGSGELRYVFFGLPADVAGAHYLYDFINHTVDNATHQFKAGPLYAEHASSQRASATRSFQLGLVHSIARKLQLLKEQRSQAMASRSGRDLVPIKDDLIDQELTALGMKFTARTVGSGRSVLSDAYHAGHAAGETFELHQGLKDGRDRQD